MENITEIEKMSAICMASKALEKIYRTMPSHWNNEDISRLLQKTSTGPMDDSSYDSIMWHCRWVSAREKSKLAVEMCPEIPNLLEVILLMAEGRSKKSIYTHIN